MEIGAFSSRWSNCDKISSYVARMISHNRTDSLLYTNLFSSALNELLETAFRSHGAAGKFVCAVSRFGELDRIELTIPGGEVIAGFYGNAVDRMGGADAAEHYREALFADGPIEPGIGLFELAIDYDAAMRVETLPGDAVRMIVDLDLEKAL
jgi:hypothetical protein